MNKDKVARLETEIGARGAAEIHSGKRSALRAWLMEQTGRTAVQILHLGTAALGEIYNDATDGKLNALKAERAPATKAAPAQADASRSNGAPDAQDQDAPAFPTPKTPEDLDGAKGAGAKGAAAQGKGAQGADTKEGQGAGEGEGAEGVEGVQAPAAGAPTGNALEDRVRQIAREEDARVCEAVTVAFKRNAVLARRQFERMVKEAAAQAAPSGPERVIVVKEGADGTRKEGAATLQHRMFPLLLKTVEAGLTPALVGPAGSGKTHAAHAVALELFGGRFELQGACVTKTDIVGFMDAGGRYQSTPFSRSFTNGGVFLADEMDAWNANALLAMNAALANGHVALPTGMTPRAKDWAAIVAMNTYGLGASRQYVGRVQLDAATLNRLAFIAWDYDAALEGALVGVKVKGAGPVDIKAGGIPTADAWVKRVQAIRAAVDRLKVRHIVSPRATQGGVKLFEVGVGQSWAEEMLIWQGMDAEQRARIEKEVR